MEHVSSAVASVLPLLCLAICFVCLSLIVIHVCRWKVHPLSKYPGPWLAKFTDLYLVFYAARGDIAKHIWLLHQQYGPIVRLGPNKLAFDSVVSLQDIYTSKNVRKAQGYEAMNPVPGVCNTHTSIDKPTHRRKRKAVSPAFSEQSMRAFEPTILRNIDVFLHQLRHSVQGESISDELSQPIDLTPRCKYFTLDVMGQFAFGRSFNMQTEEANRGMIQGMKAANIIAGLFAQDPRLNRFSFLLKYAQVKGAWTRERYGELIKGMVQSRVEAAKDAESDLFSFIIGAEESSLGQYFTAEEMWAESRLFLLAGSDTTATVLAAAFFYLSRYPACQEKLATSLRDTFQTEAEIQSGPKLSQYHYLRACIDETMRLSLPVGNPLWREVCADGVLVDREFIPGGISIGSSLYSILHSDQLFPHPFAFVPERWLSSSDSDPAQPQQARAAFKPFSLGSRSCLGINLAYAELLLVLAKALWTFEFRQPMEIADQSNAQLTNSESQRADTPMFQVKEHLTPLAGSSVAECRSRKPMKVIV